MRVRIKWAVIILRGGGGEIKNIFNVLSTIVFVTVLQLIGGVTARYNSLQVRCFQMLEMFNYFL